MMHLTVSHHQEKKKKEFNQVYLSQLIIVCMLYKWPTEYKTNLPMEPPEA